MVKSESFVSKSLTGAQLNWSTIEKECYGLYWAVKMLEESNDSDFTITYLIEIRTYTVV